MAREERMHDGNLDEMQDGYLARTMIVHHPFLNHIREQVSIYAFEHMLFQFSQSLCYVAMREGDTNLEYNIYKSAKYLSFHYKD